MSKIMMVMLMGFALCLGSVLPVMAQEEEEADFIAGTVTQVSAEALTVAPFGEEEKVLVITEETVFEEPESVDALVVGDTVFIDFIEKDGQNVALNIFKSDEGYDEEDLGELEGELLEDSDYEQEEK